MIDRPMPRLLAGLALLCCAGPALALPIAVSGRVTGPAGEAVAGARVVLMPPPGAFQEEGDPPVAVTGVVGAAGWFRVAAPGSGVWRVVAEAPGRVPVEVHRLVLTDPSEPAVLDPAVLVKDDGARFQVLAADGSPAVGALVAVDEDRSFWRSQHIADWYASPRSGRTAADGWVTLPRGHGEVLTARAVGRGGEPGEAAGDPGGSIRLRAGIVREVQALGVDGKPAAGVQVFLPDVPRPVAVTGRDGRVSLAVPAGGKTAFRLLARDGGSAAGRVAATDPGPLVVRLAPPVVSSGRVLSAADRRPLAGALVWAELDPASLVRTDAAGRYALRRAASDRFTVHAAAAGHRDLFWRAGRPIPRGPVLALEPAVELTGRVVDAAGAPVAGARVGGFQKERPHSGRLRTIQWPRTTSGEDGRFRLSGLPRGEAVAVGAVAPGLAPTWIELPPLQTDPRLTFHLTPGLAASGRVVDWGGKPVAGAEVTLLPSPGLLPLSREPSGGDLWRTTTGADGRFRVEGLPAGRATLRVKRPGFAPLAVRGVELAGDLGTWTLEPGATLSGWVATRDAPIAGAKIHAGQNFHLIRPESPPHREPEAVTGADGRFAIRDLRLGDTLDLWIGKQGYRPAVLAGAVAGRESGAELLPAARVAGRVVEDSGFPILGAWVRLSDPAGRSGRGDRWSARVSTDAEGRFAFEGLDPWPVELTAGADGFAPAAPLPLRPTAEQPVEDLEVVLRGGAVAEGRITTAGGAPVQGVEVLAGEVRTASDGDGVWRLDGVPAGMAMLTLTREGSVPMRRDLEIRPGVNRLDVTLPASREVSGTVRDPAGHAVAGVFLTLTLDGRFPSVDTVSAEDGTFRFAVGNEGTWELRAQKEGWADRRMLGLRVAGAPLAGLEVTLAPGATVAGRLLGIADRDLAEVEIVGRPADGPQRGGRVEARGRYELADLAPGEWRIEVRVHGERWGERRVTVGADAAGGPAILADLLPTAPDRSGERIAEGRPPVAPPPVEKPAKPKPEGLALEPLLSSGQRPGTLTVLFFERGSDRTLVLTKGVGADGLARFPEIAAGDWGFLASAPGGALTPGRASATSLTSGERVRVVLPIAGRLAVLVPELGRGSVATVMLVGPGGHAHSVLDGVHLRNVFPVVDGRGTLEGVPAGAWEVRVTADDGRAWTGAATTTGGDSSVVLAPP